MFSKHDRRAAIAASRCTAPRPGGLGSLAELQRKAGNRAVAGLVVQLRRPVAPSRLPAARSAQPTVSRVTSPICEHSRGYGSLSVSVTPPSLVAQGNSYFFQGLVDVTGRMGPAHACKCIEYRQHVRGVAKINGREVSNRFPLPGGSLGRSWREDGRALGDVMPGFSPSYGHRDSMNARNDAYVPTRDEGCIYNNYDTPGFRLRAGTWRPGDYLELYLSFRGELIQGRRVVTRRYWEVKGTAQVPGRPTGQSAAQSVQRTSWEERFMTAAASGHGGRLRLINEAIAPDRGRYRSLRLPVRDVGSSAIIAGGVYYDPALREVASTEWGQATSSGVRLERRDDQFDNTRPAGSVFNFIVLGPGALSPGTRGFTREMLYHESEHFRHAQQVVRSGWSRILAWAGRSPSQDADEEVFAHTRGFRYFFRHLEWRGSLTGRGSMTVPDPAEAAYDLVAIQTKYWAQASSGAKTSAVNDIIATVGANPTLRRKLVEVVSSLRERDDAPASSGLRSRLLAELSRRGIR